VQSDELRTVLEELNISQQFLDLAMRVKTKKQALAKALLDLIKTDLLPHFVFVKTKNKTQQSLNNQVLYVLPFAAIAFLSFPLTSVICLSQADHHGGVPHRGQSRE
jgi:hypothetical protein